MALQVDILVTYARDSSSRTSRRFDERVWHVCTTQSQLPKSINSRGRTHSLDHFIEDLLSLDLEHIETGFRRANRNLLNLVG